MKDASEIPNETCKHTLLLWPASQRSEVLVRYRSGHDFHTSVGVGNTDAIPKKTVRFSEETPKENSEEAAYRPPHSGSEDEGPVYRYLSQPQRR